MQLLLGRQMVDMGGGGGGGGGGGVMPDKNVNCPFL